ncbi:RNA-binding domain-containing protein [Hypoxylon trugodes]|uniref:RNA-binding domain-containing protein n=1 Tax=Hypoxylon trugodes TaxID=326681 RepID=UPI002196C75A|nr:RNA-binding domain-containing protein [Hypoxylon trugodes]KAI1384045.1 RNA-binding domain-containing protein [Hypoxylon trugodes]
MDSSRIFVKGLPPNLNEADLRKHFASKGHITDVKLIPHRRIGYVGYKTSQEAADAVGYFNRSFVRMSKISVELAKPIADPSLIKAKERRKKSTATTAALSVPTKQLSQSETTLENAKKRKRDDLDESDPKLQEFLSVMQPTKTSASKIHGVATEPIDEPPTKYAALAAAEGESDDEYEVVPSRRKKTQPVGNPKSTPSLTKEIDEHPQEEPNVVFEEPPKEQEDTVPASSAPGAPRTAATDDDWLRSRTNRLLDLVDDDDVVPTALPPEDPPSIPPIQDQEPEIVDATVDENGDEEMVDADHQPGEDEPEAETKDETLDTVQKTKRLFIRNLPYSATEDDLRSYFGNYGDVEEVHVPMQNSNENRGIGFVLFTTPNDAVKAFQADRSSFQGRILHVLPGSAKRDHNLDEFALSKLPLKQQNLIKKKAKAAESRFNWNSLYMSQDAVNSSVADRLGISKAELLDPTNADAAVKQAIAETSTIQDTKAYLVANGVDLDAFKSGARGDQAILVKNFSYGTTIEEIRTLFEEHGQVLKVLMPPTGTIAIVQFAQAPQAKLAFTKLAYRRFKDSILFLEKAPKNLFVGKDQQEEAKQASKEPSGVQKLSASELLEQDRQDSVESTSLFVKNLHWDTTTEELANEFKHLEGFRAAQVKTKKDPKKPGQLLSMGFGFVSFSNKETAEAALKVMDGHVLRAHKLQVRASHRGRDAAEERRKEDNAKKTANQRTKIVIKNLPFQANKKDISTLLSTYGQLKSVRIPKKFNSTSKGFAFAEFVSSKEAESAMLALEDTHLLGRRLVLEYAEAEAIDPEEEIAKMQKKVGGQASKVALQQLTGAGRKRVTLGGEEDEGEI